MLRPNTPLTPRAPVSSRALAAAREICRRHARSFYFASFFLPRQPRRHAYNVYAFCRLLDDAVDEAGSPAAAVEALERMTRVLDDAYAGRPPRPPGQAPGLPPLPSLPALEAFAWTVAACDIPRRWFDDLVAGCRLDLAVRRYETWRELENYCYHVAGAVGLIMCRVLGVTDPTAERQAIAMGNAMQLTNILRDVKEDLARGRIYLPAEDLAHFDVTEEDLFAGRCDEPFRALMRFEIERARGLFAEGERGLAKIPAGGCRLTVAVMDRVYGGILDAIEQADYDVFTSRRRLTLAQKLTRLPAAWRTSRRT